MYFVFSMLTSGKSRCCCLRKSAQRLAVNRKKRKKGDGKKSNHQGEGGGRVPGGRVKLTNSPGGSVIKRYVRTDGGGAEFRRGRAVPGALITPSSEETQASGGQIAQLIVQ